jgi:dipeptidase E
MRLFLSSYRFGNHADLLVELMGEQKDVAVITNAKDYKSADERKKSVQDLFASFEEIGLKPHEIDLRPFFGHSDMLELELAKYDTAWLAGGNTFVLRKALKYAGAESIILDRLEDEEFLYGGESAGAVVAAPTLKGVEFGDDPYVEIEGYSDEEIWDGLDLVPYSIVPHYESDWEGAERMVDVLEENNMPYKTLTDAQVLIVIGEQTEVLS